MALSLAFGILVADLTNLHGVTAAGAQVAPRGTAVANGTVVGSRIRAVNVLVNGVATSGVFRGSVAIADSLVYNGGGGYEDNGIFPHVSEGSSADGIFPHVSDSLSAGGIFPHVSDSLSAGGIFPHVSEGLSAGGIFPHVAATSPDPQLTGGVVEGDNVRVDKGGNITGGNLKVVGTVVSGGPAGSVLIGPGGTSTAPTF